MNDYATDNVARLVLLIVIVVQSLFFMSRWSGRRVLGSLLGQRDEGLALSAALATLYLAYVSSLLGYLIEPRWMAWSQWAWVPAWCRWCGGAILVAGTALAIAGQRALGRNYVFSVSPHRDNQLVTQGVYRWIRHPLYSAFALQAVGTAILMANWFVGLAAGLLWSLLAYRTEQEEQQLVLRYGDEYRHYMARTGRFLPRWRHTKQRLEA